MAHETVGWLQEHEKFMLPVLEPIPSYFSIPRLDDKPQDPIVQTLPLLVQAGDSPALPLSSLDAKVSPDVSTQVSKPVLTPLWNEALASHPRDVVSLLFVIELVQEFSVHDRIAPCLGIRILL
jgi:hypothetical protein